jgi:hypothetical protein
MSMELTNDTLQQAGGVPFLGAAANDTDSFSFHGFNQTKEGTHNITDNVPGLSTLVEEDEEAFAAAARDSGGQQDDEMELTGATGPQAAGMDTCSQVGVQTWTWTAGIAVVQSCYRLKADSKWFVR